MRGDLSVHGPQAVLKRHITTSGTAIEAGMKERSSSCNIRLERSYVDPKRLVTKGAIKTPIISPKVIIVDKPKAFLKKTFRSLLSLKEASRGARTVAKLVKIIGMPMASRFAAA